MAAFLIAAITLCGSGLARSDAATAEKTRFVVSILPQQYFVERIGGEYVEVTVLVGPGQSPHTYEITPRQVAGLAGAKAYFTTGLPFENVLVEKIRRAFPGLEVVDTCEGIKLRAAEGGQLEAESPQPGAEGREHAHGEPDPHVWLNPRLVKLQAATICRTLARMDPPRAARYGENLAAFLADLDALDARIAKALGGLRGGEIFVYHPAFGYFAEAYGLKQVAVEMEGKEPGPKQLAALIDKAKSAGVRVIFVQPQFSSKGAEAVANATGAAVIPMDPLARDYIKNLDDMAGLVESALTGADEVAGEKGASQ